MKSVDSLIDHYMPRTNPDLAAKRKNFGSQGRIALQRFWYFFSKKSFLRMFEFPV